jgi:hypothetical protein
MVADPKHSQMAKVLEQVRAISSLFGLIMIHTSILLWAFVVLRACVRDLHAGVRALF